MIGGDEVHVVQILVTVLSALMATVIGALVLANIFVVSATILHKRQVAMRFLSHFTRAVILLRLSDSYAPSRPYRLLKK